MPLFDPTKLGSQGRSHDGSTVSLTVNGVKFPGCAKSFTWACAVEGIEYNYGLGKRKPVSKTRGVIKPGECVIEWYAEKVAAVLRTISESGGFFDSQCDIEATLDEASNAGIAALAASLVLPTDKITVQGCDLSSLSGKAETGGSALIVETKFMPLAYEFSGMSGAA